MICKKCNSERVGIHDKHYTKNKVRMKCADCKHTWSEEKTTPEIQDNPKVGMSLDEFRDKHDVEFIIGKTLEKLDRDMIYEKNDLVKMSGLPYGAQGLSTILESKSTYYGKISGKVYYSHPDTIKMLKDQAKLN